MNHKNNEGDEFLIQVQALYKHYFEEEEVPAQDLLKMVDFCFWRFQRKIHKSVLGMDRFVKGEKQ